MGEHHDMDSDGGVVQAHAAIATTASISGCWTLPDVTGTGRAIYGITKIFDGHPAHDFIENNVSAALKHNLPSIISVKTEEENVSYQRISKASFERTRRPLSVGMNPWVWSQESFGPVPK